MANVRASGIAILLCAASIGTIVGVASVDRQQPVSATLSAAATTLAVESGLKRMREPRPGDRWGGCNDARRAGTAPIYRGEAGYGDYMDGDGDGIACEPAP